MTATARRTEVIIEPTYRTSPATVQILKEETRDLSALVRNPYAFDRDEAEQLRAHVRHLVATVHTDARENRPQPMMPSEERAHAWKEAYALQTLGLRFTDDAALLATAQRIVEAF